MRLSVSMKSGQKWCIVDDVYYRVVSTREESDMVVSVDYDSSQHVVLYLAHPQLTQRPSRADDVSK